MTNAAFNGREGVRGAWDKKAKRFEVTLEGTGKRIRVKAINLRRCGGGGGVTEAVREEFKTQLDALGGDFDLLQSPRPPNGIII